MLWEILEGKNSFKSPTLEKLLYQQQQQQKQQFLPFSSSLESETEFNHSSQGQQGPQLSFIYTYSHAQQVDGRERQLGTKSTYVVVHKTASRSSSSSCGSF
jgi:hypothetical protein